MKTTRNPQRPQRVNAAEVYTARGWKHGTVVTSDKWKCAPTRTILACDGVQVQWNNAGTKQWTNTFPADIREATEG